MEQQDHPVSTEVGRQREFYLDVDEAARLLNLTRGEVIHRAECGAVPAHKLRHGRRFCWKFKQSELEAELRNREGAIGELSIQ